MMNFIKTSAYISHLSLRKMFSTPKLYIVLILTVALLYYPCREIADYANNQHIGVVPYIFPFLMIARYFKLASVFGLILLLCDAPFKSEDQLFIIIRSKKSTWIVGQILYITQVATIYFVYSMFISIILLIPHIKFSMGWGDILNTLSQTKEIQLLFIDVRIIECYSPFLAILHSLLLNSLLGIFLGMLIFIFNTISKKAVGAVVAVGVTLFSLMSNGVSDWFSPVNLTLINKMIINDEIIQYPTMIYSYLFFIVSIFIMAIIIYIFTRKNILGGINE